MFARNLIASAAAFVSLAAAAVPAVAEDVTLPSRIALLNVDTDLCRDGASTSAMYAMQAVNCPYTLNMPEYREIKRMRTKVSYALCPTVKTTDPETGKVVKNRECRTKLTVAQLNSLNDYAVVSLFRQLDLR